MSCDVQLVVHEKALILAGGNDCNGVLMLRFLTLVGVWIQIWGCNGGSG